MHHCRMRCRPQAAKVWSQYLKSFPEPQRRLQCLRMVYQLWRHLHPHSRTQILQPVPHRSMSSKSWVKGGTLAWTRCIQGWGTQSSMSVNLFWLYDLINLLQDTLFQGLVLSAPRRHSGCWRLQLQLQLSGHKCIRGTVAQKTVPMFGCFAKIDAA